MEDRAEKRQAHILERGEYTLKRDPVESAVPEWLGTSKEDAPNNRLGLAQWLVDPSHPLTSRVTVNRLWQQFFGIGIVRTSEDFGVQGERPVHPELLDWLAIEFIENGWDVQAFQKTLLLSAPISNPRESLSPIGRQTRKIGCWQVARVTVWMPKSSVIKHSQ